MPRTEFIGREALEGPSTVVAAMDGEIALDRTPFYAEAGGQVGDTGVLLSPSTGETLAVVESTYAPAPGKSVSRVKLVAPIKEGDAVIARVDAHSRPTPPCGTTPVVSICCNAALRTVLRNACEAGGQRGRAVALLRFDFTHYTALDPDEVAEVERLMNEEILANRVVHTDVMDLDQALQTGAMALFGEKYGDRVRVVSIDKFSRELCGAGTHVSRTGDIGICKIIYEGSISAGVRRIEAITGEGALRRFQEDESKLSRVVGAVQGSAHEVVEQVAKMLEEKKSIEHELQQLKTRLAQSEAGDLESKARDVKGVKVLAARVSDFDRPQLRTMVDSLKNKWGEAVIVLGSATDGTSVSIVAGVTKGLTGKVHAGKLAGAVAAAVGGKGGGRPDMAEAGGKDVAALDGALANVYATVEGML